MFGSPVRAGYGSEQRHGPLLFSETTDREHLLTTSESLPGTPQHLSAPVQPRLRMSRIIQERSNCFDELLASAVKQVEKQEERVKGMSGGKSMSPETNDAYVVKPFVHRSNYQNKERGSPAACVDTSISQVSMDSTEMREKSEVSSTNTPTMADRPPPVVAWNTPTDELSNTQTSCAASPRRIIVQAMTDGWPEGMEASPVPAPTPFRPAKCTTGVVSRVDEQQSAHPRTIAWTGDDTSIDSDDDNDDHEGKEKYPHNHTNHVTFSKVHVRSSCQNEDEHQSVSPAFNSEGELYQESEEGAISEYTDPATIMTAATTALQEAAACGQIATVNKLLNKTNYGLKGIDINEMDSEGRTALVYAVHCNQQEIARLLLQHGAGIDFQGTDGAAALHRAAYCGTRSMVSLLLEHDANCEISDDEGRLPLHWSTYNPDVGCLSALLKTENRKLVDCADRSGMTPLLWAAYFDRSHNAFYFRPRHIQKLLRHSANVTIADIDGKTALHWACSQMNMKSLKQLVAACDTTAVDNIGRTAIHYATEIGNTQAIKTLLRARPTSLHDVDINGRTPLHYAAVCMQPKAISTLLKFGAKIDVHDTQGLLPLDYALKQQHAECIALLEAARDGRAPTIENQQTIISKAVPSSDALTEVNIEDPSAEVQTLFALLAQGTYLLKYTNDGKGTSHNRFFWIDMATWEVCWAKTPNDFRKNPGSVEGRPLTDVLGQASVVVRNRPDYDPKTTHKYAFIINTAGKRLDVIAPSEEIMRLWVEGARCMAAYRDRLFEAMQQRYSGIVQDSSSDSESKNDYAS